MLFRKIKWWEKWRCSWCPPPPDLIQEVQNLSLDIQRTGTNIAIMTEVPSRHPAGRVPSDEALSNTRDVSQEKSFYVFNNIWNGFLPICMTLPKTEVLSTVLQFHLRCRNWYWHSLMPVLAPSPMYCMWSWYKWQSFFCPWESPASWLQRGCAPMIYTSDIWTGLFIPSDLKREGVGGRCAFKIYVNSQGGPPENMSAIQKFKHTDAFSLLLVLMTKYETGFIELLCLNSTQKTEALYSPYPAIWLLS